MKIPLTLSVVLHGAAIAIVFLITLSHPWQFRPATYQVELVSLPPGENKAPAKAAAVQPAPKPEPKPVASKKPVPVKKKTEKKVETPAPAEPQKTETEASGGSQLKIDAENFPFAYYLNLIRYRIQENWQPPYQRTAEDEKNSTVVGFRIERNGKVTEIKVENSSGKFLFDQAAQRAVYSANPLPPLPDEFTGAHLTIHIEFEAAK